MPCQCSDSAAHLRLSFCVKSLTERFARFCHYLLIYRNFLRHLQTDGNFPMKTFPKYSSGQVLYGIHRDKQKAPVHWQFSHRAMAQTLDSANSDFRPSDTESPNCSRMHFSGGGKQKIKKKVERCRGVKKRKKKNTNLLIGTSAACSGETAGCQTLKGTGAEFNASCQGSLMWLSPPARAAIVKLSGSGKDAQAALRDALLAVPTPGTSLQTQQGVGGIHHLHQSVSACVHARMCEFKLCDIIVLAADAWR